MGAEVGGAGCAGAGQGLGILVLREGWEVSGDGIYLVGGGVDGVWFEKVDVCNGWMGTDSVLTLAVDVTVVVGTRQEQALEIPVAGYVET